MDVSANFIRIATVDERFSTLKKCRIACMAFALFLGAVFSGCVPAQPRSSATQPSPAADSAMISDCESLESAQKLLEARDCYVNCVRENPLNPELQQKVHLIERALNDRCARYVQAGLEHDREGRCDLARNDYRAALEIRPSDATALAKLESNKTSFIIHEIRPNETISKLALLYYSDFNRYAVIGRFNELSDTARVEIGQMIRIPEIEGVTVEELMAINAQYRKNNYRLSPVTAAAKVPEHPSAPPPSQETSGSPQPKAPAPPAVPDETQHYIIHRMQYGDTISEIASVYYGTASIYPLIIAYNKLSDVRQLDVGDEIKLPAINGISTDRLSDIARNYKREKTEKINKALGEKENVASASPQPPDGIQPRETKEQRVESPVKEDPLSKTDAINPSSSTAQEETETAGPLSKGIQLFNSRDYDNAVEELNIAAGHSSSRDSANAYLSKIYFQQGMLLFHDEAFLEAGSKFKAALESDPECGTCNQYIEKCMAAHKEKNYALGINAFSNENLADAIRYWKQVCSVDPDYKDVRTNLEKAEQISRKLEMIRKSDAL